MSQEPFFTRDGGRFITQPVSRGPWDPTSMHGRVVVGLLGAVIEAEHGGPAFTPARLTVDMYRLPDLSPVEVTTRLVREGRRIKVVDAEFFSQGKSMARATCQLLRRAENPEGKVWSTPNWDAPGPDALPEPTDPRSGLNGMWEIRPIVGSMGTLGQRRLWMREVRELIGGEPLTPFARCALAADFASPFANAGEKGLQYINSDATLYLHRLPVSEWIGFEVAGHGATEGVAIGDCRIYDVVGPIGTASVAALAQQRRLGGG
jgi:hypothetical protein